MQEVSEISSLIDLVDNKSQSLYQPSSDHLAFEFFDKVVDLSDFEYTKYEDQLHKEIYGDDEFNRGYESPKHMRKYFADIYDNDHPTKGRGLSVPTQLSYDDIPNCKFESINIIVKPINNDFKKKEKDSHIKYHTPKDYSARSDFDFVLEYNKNYSKVPRDGIEYGVTPRKYTKNDILYYSQQSYLQ